ncbi:MAG TPA: 50S ribosomal protein L10 [Acidimicrobiales bacterium]|nr:MAG: 50S ribosomal protein L10 [Actinobacteria bacterium 21-73-9]HQU26365.1 50S ribosomal protein L10 [Acidimicrobiales bacterium]
MASKVRTEKAAAVEDVKSRVATTSTAVVTEYRGLTVTQIQELRRQLRAAGADYKVFKNTLVRRAIAGTGVESLATFLEGPTAIAFVSGDVSAVAKALRDFAKGAPALVVKGGVLNGQALSDRELVALADLPSREVLLARLAGLIASPLTTMAGLFKAVPQNLAYGLAALIDQRGGAPEGPAAETETPAGVEEAAPAAGDDAVAEAAATPEAPAAEDGTDSAEAAAAEDAPAE